MKLIQFRLAAYPSQGISSVLTRSNELSELSHRWCDTGTRGKLSERLEVPLLLTAEYTQPLKEDVGHRASHALCR